MNLREAAQQALEALDLAGMSHDVMLMSDPPQDAWKARSVSWKLAQAMTALRAALADTQDWNEVEALRASLREHMAEIHRLRVAGRQALDAMDYTRWAVADYAQKWGIPRHDAAMNTLRAALAEGVPETTFGNMAQAVDSKEADHIRDATKMVASVREDRTIEPVGYGVFEDGNLHDSFRLEHEAKLFAALKGEHAEVHALYIAPAKCEPVATLNEMETVEPVAYVTGYRDGWCVISPVEHVVFPTGMALYRSPPTSQESRQVEPVAWITPGQDLHSVNYEGFQDWIPLYTAPPKREPLTESFLEELAEKHVTHCYFDTLTYAREIERLHGIGGEE